MRAIPYFFRTPVFLAILLFPAGFSVAFAQTTIVKGIVEDHDNGEPLAFATVMFTGTTIGTTTDIDGQYELRTDNPGLESVTISYVGYEPKEIKVKPGKLNEESIRLREIKLELETVEIKGRRRVPKDTAAIELFKNVVANKYRNDPSEYEYYSYDQYTKMEFGLYDLSEKFKESKLINRFDYVLDNIEVQEDGTEVLPVLLKETATEHRYRKNPAREKTILKGDRFSGVDNATVSDLVQYNFEPIEIYGNLITINGKPLMSPFADNARFSYKYFLTDTAVFDGLTCYKLEFTGRGNSEAAFTGHAWIHDSTYAIQGIQLIVLANSNINFISDFLVEQTFRLIDGQYWFKDYEFMQTQYNLLKKKGKDKQSFLVRKSDTRSDITVNEPIPDEQFDGEADIILSEAREQGDAFWDSTRTDPLNNREANIFRTVDSIKSSGFYKALRWFTYLGTSGWMDAKYVEFGRIYQLYSWNDVEGGRFRLTMRTRENLSKRIQFAPHFAYGLKDETWKYGIQIRTHLKRRNENWHMLGLEYSYDMSDLTDVNPILRPNPTAYDNIGLSLLRTEPLNDLFLLRRTNFWYEREWVKGLSTRIGFEHKIHESVPTGKTFTTSDGNGGNIQPINHFTTSTAQLSLIWAKSLKFYESGFHRFPLTSVKPILSIDYKGGIPKLFGSDFKYHSLLIGLRQRLLGPIGYTVYTAEAGGVFGRVPYPVLGIHPGNESFLYSQWAYQTMNENEFMSDRCASLWVIHHFDGFIFDKIPGISKLQLRSLIGIRALYGHLTPQNRQVFDLPEGTMPLNGFFVEAGFGLENILKILRVDVYFRVTQRDRPDASKWGIKFYIAPQF